MSVDLPELGDGGGKKAKVHIVFDLNRSISNSKKIFITDGKGDERSFINKILAPGETASWIAIISAISVLTNDKPRRENFPSSVLVSAIKCL
ncbi:MAG: hypothetical protein KJ814_05960 [Proteobacteria bacterium]|nr:hypothetical protein [Pseudomonadota bacterium]MBU2027148.1 hypothetical protein [Pseudomonadota bacterium]